MKRILTVILLSFAAAVLSAAGFTVNNKTPGSGFTEGNDKWTFERKYDLTNKELPPELLIPAKAFKQHPKHAYIRGVGNNLLLQIKAPGRIRELECAVTIGNYADSRQRTVAISWSLDGIGYTELAAKQFKGGTAAPAGKVSLPENRGIVFIRVEKKLEADDKNGIYSFVLFQKLELKLSGEYRPETASQAPAAAEPSKALKTVFPTGVFWPWERVAPNAKFAKMELWDFVEQTMKTIRENGYDTCWMVNFPVKEQQKFLKLAEKHGLRILINTDLYGIHYNGVGSLDYMEQAAFRTFARIGGSPALLGYVLKDEPVLCDLDTCGTFYDYMKKVDPGRDSVAVVMNRQSMSYLRDSKLPVVCSDIYYFADKDSTMLPSPREVGKEEFTNALKSYGNAAELYGKHSWFMGQMFGDVWGRHWFNGKKTVVYPGCYLHWRMPTEAESCWQIWEALRLGTKGVFIYVLYPPVPLLVPPEKATEPAQLKRIERMDKAAARAASWKNQKLVKKVIEIDPGEGMLQPGGKPTPQMLATAPVMKLIRANEQLLVNRRKADFPVFFANDARTDVETYVSGSRWFGIIVNRDVDHARKAEILLPVNVTSVTDLASKRELKPEPAGDGFRKITLELAAGNGALLEARFAGHPGIRFCRESFDQQSMHRVNINSGNAEIFNHGNYGADENRSLRLKKDGDAAKSVCALLALSNPKKPYMTFTKNLSRGKKGVTYCLIRGKLKNAVIKAASLSQEGEQSNTAHLSKLKTVKLEDMKSSVIQDSAFYRPVIVPPDAAALEFFLGKRDYIEDITVWYVPR